VSIREQRNGIDRQSRRDVARNQAEAVQAAIVSNLHGSNSHFQVTHESGIGPGSGRVETAG
jgi:hypothetical protein